MMFNKSFKEVVALGFSLLTFYTVNVFAQDNSLFSHIIEEDVIKSSSVVDSNSLEIRDVSFSVDLPILKADLQSKIDSNSNLSEANLKLEINQIFSPEFKGFNLSSSTDKSFVMFNKSNFSGEGVKGFTLEERVFLNSDFNMNALGVKFSSSCFGLSYKLFDEEFREGNVLHFNVNFLQGVSVGYGLSRLNDKDNQWFSDFIFNKKNFFLSAGITGEEDICLRSSFVQNNYGLIGNYRSLQEEDSFEVVFAMNPQISRNDFHLFDETYFKDEGGLSYNSLKTLRSFTDKSFAFRYFRDKDSFNIGGVWNFLKVNIEKLSSSSWVGFDYSKSSEELLESFSTNLCYDNLSLQSSINSEKEMSIIIDYNVLF